MCNKYILLVFVVQQFGLQALIKWDRRHGKLNEVDFSFALSLWLVAVGIAIHAVDGLHIDDLCVIYTIAIGASLIRTLYCIILLTMIMMMVLQFIAAAAHKHKHCIARRTQMQMQQFFHYFD